MLKIITTADGSHSLYDPELDETYHSVHGAIQESNHVYINHGFNHAIEMAQPKSIHILEVGLGTGLNVLLTLLSSEKIGLEVVYHALEPKPLDMGVVDQLNLGVLVDNGRMTDAFLKIHGATWNNPVSLGANFTFCKKKECVQKSSLENNYYDVVYFDAFAPSKQPEVWEQKVLERVVESLKPQGIFVTYSAKGQLRRDLTTLGMRVELLKGAPGKAQMIRAIKGK